MIAVITGGSGSGKSQYAEQFLQKFPQPYIYLATMHGQGTEARERICRHRKQREGKGFVTIEKGTHLEELVWKDRPTVLLECISNLVANEMFDGDRNLQQTEEHIRMELQYMMNISEHIVFVTNEVFSDTLLYDEMTIEYLQLLGRINQWLAQKADIVEEVVYGITLQIKGGRCETVK